MSTMSSKSDVKVQTKMDEFLLPGPILPATKSTVEKKTGVKPEDVSKAIESIQTRRMFWNSIISKMQQIVALKHSNVTSVFQYE